MNFSHNDEFKIVPILNDASVFELIAQDIILPQTQVDLLLAVKETLLQKHPITLRAGGTSLGGQAIGLGVIIDVSKHLNAIVEYRPEQKEVVVEPGVIQEDLNDFVASDGLHFAPDTSTANRAMIGGMIGNNSCGAYSVLYATTREHVKSVEVILSDGTEVTFEPLSSEALQQKLTLSGLEGDIYRFVIELLTKGGEKILEVFPDPSIKRRNTGYALDELVRHHQPFNAQGKPFNLTPLMCGSEGTLAVIKQATLNLVPVPKQRQLICAHYPSVEMALEQVPALLAFQPAAIELIDKNTLEGTKHNLQQQQNRFWIEGDPEAVLVIELFDENLTTLTERINTLQSWLLLSSNAIQENPPPPYQPAYAAPVISVAEASKVWAVRKAGLGLLMGKITRQKAVAVVEDAAVPVAKLADYYRDVQALMAELNVGCVYYGHASVGLIHVRPELDLATETGRELFQLIGVRISTLVKHYRGALSGEHGDGRIRAPFLPEQFGEEVYGYLVALKRVFDPKNLLNPGVIIGNTPITQHLRAHRTLQVPLKTGFDWQNQISLLDAVEKCNGAGACRKSAGRGVMCPSYQVTREEDYSTRGRSNLLRMALTEADPIQALSSAQLQKALDLCLGCKACHTECPASVDMAKLKSEVLHQTRSIQPILKRLSVQHYGALLALGAKWPAFFNGVQNLSLFKRLMNIDSRRTLPKVQGVNLSKWWRKQQNALQEGALKKITPPVVWVVCDLFSVRYSPEVAQATLRCVQKLGAEVNPIYLTHSPRTLISQGLLTKAKATLLNILTQLNAVAENDWVVGMEPSELLVWRDEAKSLLARSELNEVNRAWLKRSKPVLSFEELLLVFEQRGWLPTLKKIPPPYGKVWLHVHCHQKALANAEDTQKALQLIPNVQVNRIQSGCCGMSGEFGYKHYDLSKKIANQALLPAVQQMAKNDVLVATGISCRQQVSDLGKIKSLHIAQLFDWVL